MSTPQALVCMGVRDEPDAVRVVRTWATVVLRAPVARWAAFMLLVKALGRCAKRHTQVVEFPATELPAGVCARCGETLIEWAVKTATKERA